MPLWLLSLVSFLSSIFAVRLLTPMAKTIGLVDRPTGRKRHRGKIPLVGGVAIVFSIAVSLTLAGISLQEFRTLFLGVGVLVFIGFIDDLKPISARFRLLAQLLIAIVMVFSGKVSLVGFGDIFGFGSVHLPLYLQWVFTVLAVVVLTNAVNLLDGQDGLAGGLVSVMLAWFCFLAWHDQAYIAMTVLLITQSAVLGFLVFNVRIPGRDHALVFLGDAGSTVLGFVVAWFAVYLSQSPNIIHSVPPVSFLWILALPLFELVSSFLRRLLRGQSPLKPDREHLHQTCQKH